LRVCNSFHFRPFARPPPTIDDDIDVWITSQALNAMALHSLAGALGSLTLNPLRCPSAAGPRSRVSLTCRAEAVPADAGEGEAPTRGGRAGRKEGGGRGPGGRRPPKEKSEFDERVVSVSRVTKVVKGGKQLSFRAVVVVGNRAGKVGVGVAKAKEVIVAVQKAVVDAKKEMAVVPITAASSVPHKLTMRGNGSSDVMIRPAKAGSGITAGGSVRAVLELAGYKNVNAKMLSGSNPLNNGRACLEALKEMRTPEQVAHARGLTTEEARPHALRCTLRASVARAWLRRLSAVSCLVSQNPFSPSDRARSMSF